MSIVLHTHAGDKWLCFTCGKYYFSMFGDTCDNCRLEERRHKELVAAIKSLSNTRIHPTGKPSSG